MALKPGYFIQPRAAEITIGQFTLKPIPNKRETEEAYFEKRVVPKTKKEKKQTRRAIPLGPFALSQQSVESEEPEPVPELPDAEINRCNEMLRLLDQAFEECELSDKMQLKKREAQELAQKMEEERKSRIFVYKSRIIRSNKRK